MLVLAHYVDQAGLQILELEQPLPPPRPPGGVLGLKPCITAHTAAHDFNLLAACFCSPVPDVKVQLLPSHKRTDITVFKPFLDLETQPVLFIPDVHFTNLQRGSHVGTSLLGEAAGPAERNSWRFS